MEKIKKILLVDDHEIVRIGFRSLLESTGLYSVLEASCADSGYSAFKENMPDLVVMDLNMPGKGGLEAIRRINKYEKSVKVIVLSMYGDSNYIAFTRAEGVKGYVTKKSAPSELLKAVKEVLNGNTYYSSDILSVGDSSDAVKSGIETLSKREFEVMVLLSSGYSVVTISNNLCISPKTVSNHRDKIMKKLSINSLVDLTRFAIRHNIVSA